LPLLYELHNKQLPFQLSVLSPEKTDETNEKNHEDELKKALESCFKKSLEDWQQSQQTESNFTDNILSEALNDCWKQKDVGLNAKKQVSVGGGRGRGHGRTDILITDEDRDRPVLLVEFGLLPDDWWKKFDQARKYLRMMRCDEEGEKRAIR